MQRFREKNGKSVCLLEKVVLIRGSLHRKRSDPEPPERDQFLANSLGGTKQPPCLPPKFFPLIVCLLVFISKVQLGCLSSWLSPSPRNELQTNFLESCLLRKPSSVTGFTCLKIPFRSIKVPTNCCALPHK